VQAHASTVAESELPPTVVTGLRRLTEQVNATPFMTLFAATAVAIGHARELPEVVVGTPVANRSRPELEGLLGCLVNTVVLRLATNADPTFADLVARARTECLDAYAHAEMPFERVVQDVRPERSAGHLPLFQMWFVVQDEPPLPEIFPDVDVTPTGAPPRLARYDLRLEFRRTEASVHLVCEYKTDLFTHASIARLTRGVTRVLEIATADPGIPLDALRRRLAESDLEQDDQNSAIAQAYSTNAIKRRRRSRVPRTAR
jgi:non-ribosomal peptide synthetase component F